MNDNVDSVPNINNKPENQYPNTVIVPPLAQQIVMQTSDDESTPTITNNTNSQYVASEPNPEPRKKKSISAYKIFIGYLLWIILFPIIFLSLSVFNEDFLMAGWLLLAAVPAAILLVIVIFVHWLVHVAYIRRGASVSTQEVELRSNKVNLFVKICILVAILLFMASAIGGAIIDNTKSDNAHYDYNGISSGQ
jgi:uncharacterized membrane protein YcjF (UPF0283 family)